MIQFPSGSAHTGPDRFHIAVIVAAGKGLRFLSSAPQNAARHLLYKKQFAQLSGEAVLDKTLRAFIESGCFHEIILVLSREDFDLGESVIRRIAEETKTDIAIQIVAGGDTRFESVYNGLSYIADELIPDRPSDFCVAVHDGVRPLVTKDLIEKGLEVAARNKSALPVVALKETVKRIDDNGRIVETIPRDRLVRSQTPQTFQFAPLWQAFQKAVADPACPHESLTDEAKVFELYAREYGPVQTYPGDEENIKITTYDDLSLASAIFLRRQNL